jgi:DNA-binding transcriptional regulator YiaG
LKLTQSGLPRRLAGDDPEFLAIMKRRYRAPLKRIDLPDVDVVAVRKALGLSQPAFAHRFGFPVATLRHWERGNRRPLGCALALLHVIADNPAVAARAIMRARATRLR